MLEIKQIHDIDDLLSQWSHCLRQPKSLRIDDALSFTTTPNHRIMVPSDGEDATVKAKDLKLGSWVMCSDRVAKRVIGMRLIPVSGPSSTCLFKRSCIFNQTMWPH